MAGRSSKQTRVLVTDALDGAPWVVVMSTLVTALERIIVMGPESGHPRPVITDHGEPVGAAARTTP